MSVKALASYEMNVSVGEGSGCREVTLDGGIRLGRRSARE